MSAGVRWESKIRGLGPARVVKRDEGAAALLRCRPKFSRAACECVSLALLLLLPPRVGQI